jgi:hypothetical protein
MPGCQEEQGLRMSSVKAFVFQSILIFVPAIVSALGGLGAFRIRKSPRYAYLLQLGSATILILSSAVCCWAQISPGFWLVPAIAGLVIGIQLIAGAPRVCILGSRLLAFVRAWATPARPATLLLATCPLLLAGGLWQINAMTAPHLETMLGVRDFAIPDLVADKSLSARTDHGHDIPLFKARSLTGDSLTLAGNQGLPLLDSPLPYRAVRLTDAESVSNCAGWVFAGAHAWIQCRDVRQILDDNGYQAVKRPHPGDLAIYRDSTGEIVHVAQVSAILDGGRPLIESKWGAQGVFLHLAEGTPYGDDCHYYHSSRTSHLLVMSPSGEASSHSSADVSP